MLSGRAVVGTVALCAAAWGCAAVKPAPVVEHKTMWIPEGTLRRVAVVPFYPKETLSKHLGGGASAAAAADLVARFMVDALLKQGISVIPPSDLEIAFTGQGYPVPRADPRAAAELAAREFGATAVLLGQVSRYRERGGEKYGSSSAASVAFVVTMYSAPDAHRVWTSKFDETQRALSENVWNARRYPGGGTRWLTAAELAQWGAESSVETLPPEM